MVYFNGIYNDMYKMEKRWAMNHAPYFIDKHIMEDLKQNLQVHFTRTSKTRFRENHDTVLAFNYYHFHIGELSKHPFHLFFKELDTNGDGALDVKETVAFSTQQFYMRVLTTAAKSSTKIG